MVCNVCKGTLNFGYNKCDTCDYKLCPECFQKDGHVHDTKFTLFPKRKTVLQGYVQLLLQKYGHRVTAESLITHISRKRFFCDCFFCKPLYPIYNYHTQNCSTHGCNILRCPIVDRHLRKRPSENNAGPDLELSKRTKHSANENAPSTAISGVLAQRFTIQRCIRILVHACYCMERDCMPLGCRKMKRVLAHIKVCKRKVEGGCIVCTQLTLLCRYHAANCKETEECPVLLCSAYKRKLQEIKKAHLA